MAIKSLCRCVFVCVCVCARKKASRRRKREKAPGHTREKKKSSSSLEVPSTGECSGLCGGKVVPVEESVKRVAVVTRERERKLLPPARRRFVRGRRRKKWFPLEGNEKEAQKREKLC